MLMQTNKLAKQINHEIFTFSFNFMRPFIIENY